MTATFIGWDPQIQTSLVSYSAFSFLLVPEVKRRNAFLLSKVHPPTWAHSPLLVCYLLVNTFKCYSNPSLFERNLSPVLILHPYFTVSPSCLPSSLAKASISLSPAPCSLGPLTTSEGLTGQRKLSFLSPFSMFNTFSHHLGDLWLFLRYSVKIGNGRSILVMFGWWKQGSVALLPAR